MRKIISAVIFFVLASATAAPIPPLKDSMEEVGQAFGTIAIAVMRVKRVDETTLDAINSLQLHSANAALVLPANATVDRGLELEYRVLMARLVKTAADMETTVTKQTSAVVQDLAEAQALMQEFGAIRSEGHQKFKL